MPLIAVCYVKSRPGATTTALGLAVMLPPAAQPVVVECDPAGGDLTMRHGLRPVPGLAELATATRAAAVTSGTWDVLSGFVQSLHLGDRTVELVVAPSGGAQTRVALSVLARPGHPALSDPKRTVIADCGRLDFASPVWPLLAAADAVLVLVRGRVDELAHLREHIGELVRQVPGRVVVALAAGGVYGAGDVQAMLHWHLTTVLQLPADTVDVFELLPYDEHSAQVLGGERPPGRRWRRRPLLATIERLAAGLPVAAPTPTPGPKRVPVWQPAPGTEAR